MGKPAVSISMSDDFLGCYYSASKETQKKVFEFISKLRANPNSTGINFEKVKKAKDADIYSARINEFYRAIVKRCSENTYLLLWVARHDDAYAWAEHKKVVLNETTGIIQVFTVIEKEEIQEMTMDKKYFFDAFTDGQLIRIGLPDELLPMVRSIETIEEFHSMKENLPKDAYEGLDWLADGFDYDEVIENLYAEPVKSGDYAKALQSDVNKMFFTTIEGEEELKRLLEEPLEKWRIFLHPTQRRIVHKDYSGPARVLGGAGTGKTVVAMHRAVRLAADIPVDKKILFTTFTRNLADDIRENLMKIASADQRKKIEKQVEVTNLHAWMADFLREQRYEYKILYGKEVNKIWDDAIARTGGSLEYTRQFYLDEWIKVVHAQEAYTEEKYLNASRAGRGTALGRSRRMAVWCVIEEYMHTMDEKKLRDSEYAMYECRGILKKQQSLLSSSGIYESIIVDEGQDLSPNAYRLIRTLAGEPHKNDIFIVGDAHQRIYKNRAVLSRCGIQIRGRVDKLRINYRTTEEIRKYAFGLLRGMSFDDMDEAYDNGDHCHSLTHGHTPEIRQFGTPDEEMEFIAGEIKLLEASDIPLKNICIVARTHKLVEAYKEGLRNHKINLFEIKANKTDDSSFDGVRIATMHRVKGLEFNYIFVAGADNKTLPNHAKNDFFDDASFEEFKTEEKCLLYVALTRAKVGTYVTCYGTISDLII